MLEDEEDVSGHESDDEGETDKEADAEVVEDFGIAITSGNLPSPIHDESLDDNDRTIDAEVEVAEALEKVLEVENTFAVVIAKPDME